MSVWPLFMSAGMNNNDPRWVRRTFCELATAIYKKYFLPTEEFSLSTHTVWRFLRATRSYLWLFSGCIISRPQYWFTSHFLPSCRPLALSSLPPSSSLTSSSSVFSPFSASPFSSSRPCSRCLQLSFYTSVISLTFSSPFLLSYFVSLFSYFSPSFPLLFDWLVIHSFSQALIFSLFLVHPLSFLVFHPYLISEDAYNSYLSHRPPCLPPCVF